MTQILTQEELEYLLGVIEEGPVIDNLTGLYNRKTFDERFKFELEQAKGLDRILSFIFFDIDHFTNVNADYGHEAGDAVLRLVTKTINEIALEKAIVARYGGEEFVIMLIDIEREQAFLLAEKIRAALDKEHEIQIPEKIKGSTVSQILSKIEGPSDKNEENDSKATGKTVQIKLSISGGVAAFPTDGQNESEIIRKVDQALYRAKKTGRNKICIAQEEKMATKTTHYTLTQLERLAKLSKEENTGEAILLREALDDLLFKYKISEIET